MASEPNNRGDNPTSVPTPDLLVVRNPDSEGAQAYRSVRETLRYSRQTSPIHSVLLADVGSGDYAGEAAANIAASFALNGDPTVLIDADANHPTVHGLLNTPLSPGLIDWLTSDAGGDSIQTMPTAIDRLTILPPGDRNGERYAPIADLLTSSACQKLIADLRSSAEYIIFHASVVPVSSQALTIAAQVDAVLLIVRSGMTKRTDAQRARESLERIGARLIGVVLTESS